MQKINTRMAFSLLNTAALACLLALPAFCGGASGGNYYTEPEVYAMRPDPAQEKALDCIGATGIKARFYPGVILKVEGFTEKSPAQGKLKVGEIIAGVNGVELKGINPFVALGQALTAAEASDGRMVFDVKANKDAEVRKVTVVIPVLGKYRDTWPLNCEKSKKIIKAAADYYATDPEFRKKCFSSAGGGIPSALACLFLLSTGDDAYLPVVKAYFASFPKEVARIGDHTWNNGYNGIACAEYYLRTGDPEVLPILQYYCDDAKERQMFGCGWNHWGREQNVAYVAGGLMNPAGIQVLTTLLLGKACGVRVDEKTLLGSLKFFYRFAGHGTQAYGDHRPEGGLGSNGKDGMAAAAMRAAMQAVGDTTRYEMAMKHLSLCTLNSYPIMIMGHADEGRGDGLWRGTASSYMLDYKPADYHAEMKRLRWFYDLSRRPSGAFGMAGCQGFDDVGSGVGVALAYTAPLKTLAITGAPRSKYAKKFTLPENIWGNEADLAFLSLENAKTFSKYGKEDPIEVPFYTFGNAYAERSAADLAGVAKSEILKNVYHKNYLIRAQAAKALRITGAFADLEALLGDRDPRVRRAALDGLCDYNYWGHLGRNPLSPEQFTPGMVEAVAKMLSNKKEALWVTDGALSVLSCMPPATVGKHLDLVMPWARHEDWWLRQSAFSALATAARDPKLVAQVLPTLLEMMLREDHTMPRDGMVYKLDALLRAQGPGSPAAQQILTAHLKAAAERTIIPGIRADEGEHDVGQSIDVVVRESPGQVLALAKAMQKRFGELSTAYLVKLSNDLRGAAPKVPGDQRAELEKLLFDDYRPALVDRMKTGESDAMIDAILALLALKDPDAGWREFGKVRHAERLWRYTTLEPKGADVLHPREKRRFRNIALPAELKGWFEPGFDDSGWKTGKAPIGVGIHGDPRANVPNATPWGDDEFVLMRSTFELDATDFDYVRIKVLANQGYDIYLNGRKIFTYGWWNDTHEYAKIMLDNNQKALLRKGTNHLAVLAGSDRFLKGVHVGQIDLYLEGLRKKDVLATPTPKTAQAPIAAQPAAPLTTGTDELARGFQQPPESARTGVFWFWINGNITREGITADLESMARVGIKTVLLFETCGEIPEGPVKFLSAEWRALFSHALEESARLGLTLNMNNDAGWCGSGGPWNTPEHSMQKLVSTRTPVEGGKPFDAVLAQPPAVKDFYRDVAVLATKVLPSGDATKKVWPLSHAVDLTAKMEAGGRLRWDPPAGDWEILRIGHTSTGKDNHPSPASGTGPECDKLSKIAVKAHFEGMMAKLIRDAGPLAGKTLQYTHIDSWEVGTQNWTLAFRAEFQRLRGYDPLPLLPGELGYIVADPETHRRFQWDMRMTVSDLMLENYAGYFRELAAAHGLKLSIEAYGAHPGHCPANNLSYAGRADLPIGEFWVGHNNYRSCKEMASASHVYGKRVTGAEAFTAWPDNARRQFHPGNIKAMGDQCFCAGVNFFYLSFFTHQPWLERAPGMTMQGWGTHFDRTETWWEQSKAWNTYLARCQHLLQSGLFAADVCYLDLEDAPRDAPYPIKLPGYDYDVCPAEVVKTRMSVKDGRITLPDNMSYRLLVLPPTDRMTPETLRKVVDLAKAGATLAATMIPSQSPSLQNHPRCDAEVKALARELFGDVAAAPATGIRESRCGAGRVLLGGDVTQALTALGIQPDITFTTTDKPESFRWIHRRTETAEFYFLSNQLAEEKQVTCTFRVTSAQPELWHPETGRITRLPVYKSTADGRIEVPLKFGPEEAFFVVFPKSGTSVASAGAHSKNWPEFQPAMTVEGPWQVTFDPKWGGPQKPVRFEALSDWSSNTVEGIKFYSGTAVYQKSFRVEPAVAGLPSVVLDLGQVEIMADVKLNGKELGTLWKKPFRIDVTGHLKPGDNQLELRVVNLWCNRLIGDEHLPEAVEWKDGFMGWGGQFDLIKSWPQWLLDNKPSPGGRFTFTTARYYKKGDALKPSGLLGPVRLLVAQ